MNDPTTTMTVLSPGQIDLITWITAGAFYALVIYHLLELAEAASDWLDHRRAARQAKHGAVAPAPSSVLGLSHDDAQYRYQVTLGEFLGLPEAQGDTAPPTGWTGQDPMVGLDRPAA